jgi:DNA-directed RNA polymerase subunit RPC12/RpoP
MSDRVLEVANYSTWPRDTRARCPQCRSADILALGRVLADTTGMLRSAYRCRECAREFLLLIMERRIGPRDRRAT